MSLGFKLVIAFYLVALVVTFIKFPSELSNPSGFILIWTIVGAAMKILSIIGIYLKRWGKLILAYMIVAPLAGLAYIVKLLAFPPAATNVLQLNPVLAPAQTTVSLISALSVILGLMIFFYVYHHRYYFHR